MEHMIRINNEDYKKLQAALMLTGEEETTVLQRMINEYSHAAFMRVMGKEETKPTQDAAAEIAATEQKRLFVNWFRNLTRNGNPYNPVTISGYTGRIENACADPAFASIPVKNLFAVTDLHEFLTLQYKIKNCAGYVEFDSKSHNGFTAALRKYEEFLRFQTYGGNHQMMAVSQQPARTVNVHRWTMEEDTICCRRFLECYVLNRSNMDIVQFLRLLSKEVPDVSEGSLRMKIQNVKYLAARAGLQDTAEIKWLSQYSMQCERAFQNVVRELNIQ